MRGDGTWVEEHWDVIAIVSAFAIALAISGALGVAYNVTAGRRVETRAPERRPTSAAPATDPGPRQPAAPYS